MLPVAEQHAHCVAWIRENILIENPERPGGMVDFALYDYQEQQLLNLINATQNPGGVDAGLLTEKSRQMGDTWLTMAFELWTITHWRSRWRALNISRKQQIVDDGGSASTTDSLHGKLRFMWDHLPGDQKAPLTFRHLRIINRVTGAAIIGEASVPDAGAGGTYWYGLWDETARTPKSWVIYAAWQQAVRCPFYLSTPKGKGGLFPWLRFKSNIKVIRHHWTEHPEKSAGMYRCPGGVTHPRHASICEGGEWRSPWYDDQCRKMPPEIVAQELDIDYEASLPGRAFPEFDAYNHAVGDLGPEESGVWVAAIDPGVTMAGMVLCHFVPLAGALELRVLDHWEGPNAVVATYDQVLAGWEKRWGLRPKYLSGPQLTGDPSGYNRDMTDGTSVFGELRRRHGRQVTQSTRNVKDRVRQTRDFMGGGALLDGRTASFGYRADLEMFAEHMDGAKWPTNQDGVVTRETDLEHNEHEHTADALTYAVAHHLSPRPTVMRDAFARPNAHTAGLVSKTW